jgi:hypothetical protein
MRTTRFWVSFSVLGLLLAGCGAAPGEGELGNDRFLYACVERSDAACDDASSPTASLELLPVLAKGAVFRLLTENPANVPYSPTPRLTVIDGEAVTFRAEMAGYSAIFARDANGNVRDLVHAMVVEPAAVTLLTRQGGSAWLESGATLSVPVGSTVALRSAPADALGHVLAGALDVVWSSTPEDLLATVAKVDGNVLLIAPEAPAEGELKVTVAGSLLAKVKFVAAVGGGK